MKGKKRNYDQIIVNPSAMAIKVKFFDWLMQLMFRSTPGMNVLATSLVCARH